MDDLTPVPIEQVDDLPDELRHRIKAELQPGERLLWSSRGMPRGRTGCSPIAVGLLIVGSFLLSGVALAAFFGKLGGPPADGTATLVFGLGAAAVGLVTLFGVLSEWLTGRSKRSPVESGLYALTDRRAIIWKRAPFQAGAVEVTTIARGQARLIRRVEHPDGSGDVLFAVQDAWLLEGEGWKPGGFEGITDVRRVEDLARRILFADPTQNES